MVQGLWVAEEVLAQGQIKRALFSELADVSLKRHYLDAEETVLNKKHIKKETKMKVLVTLAKDGGLENYVCEHFGHCTHFLIAEIKNGKVDNYHTVENKASHGGGGCLAVTEALQYDIDAVVSGGMGGGAQQKLLAGGVKIFGFNGTVKDALEEVIKENLSGIAPCPGHDENGCHH